MADSNKKYAPYILLVMVATLAVGMWKSGNEPELTPVVNTPQGPVQGVVTESDFANFKGCLLYTSPSPRD